MDMEETTERIARCLEHLKQFTSTPGEGCTRLPFSQEARAAVDYLKAVMQEAGLKVSEDAAGNVIGIIEGREPELPCVLMGSHYDSVYNGGDYDGAAGVIAAIEVARFIKENNIPLRRNFAAVGFCDEEGVRFGNGYFGSGAILGKRDVEYCRKFTDKDGISIYDAMKDYGLKPECIKEAKWKDGSIGAYIEMHIEQGPVLDTKGIELGLVNCIVGIQRYAVKVYGRADHAGTTPMDMRMDAVDGAAKVISRIADWAREKADGTVATVGYIHTIPGGMNIVSKEVEFTVDIRSGNNDNINDIVQKIKQALDCETNAFGGSYDMINKLTITPVELSDKMLNIMEESCKEKGYSYLRMPSGAGHDALEIGQSIPSVMLFIPSKDGRSHCPEEFSKYGDIAKATGIMAELAIKLNDM